MNRQEVITWKKVIRVIAHELNSLFSGERNAIANNIIKTVLPY